MDLLIRLRRFFLEETVRQSASQNGEGRSFTRHHVTKIHKYFISNIIHKGRRKPASLCKLYWNIRGGGGTACLGTPARDCPRGHPPEMRLITMAGAQARMRKEERIDPSHESFLRNVVHRLFEIHPANACFFPPMAARHPTGAIKEVHVTPPERSPDEEFFRDSPPCSRSERPRIASHYPSHRLPSRMNLGYDSSFTETFNPRSMRQAAFNFTFPIYNLIIF